MKSKGTRIRVERQNMTKRQNLVHLKCVF